MQSKANRVQPSSEHETNGQGTPSAGAAEPQDERRGLLRSAVRENRTRAIRSMMGACVHCGLCADACHFYLSTQDPALIPANKIARLARVLRDHCSPVRSRLPFLGSSGGPGEQELSGLSEAAYQNCTLCGRCSLICPMGIDAGKILYLGRAMLCKLGQEPAGLSHPVEVAFETGNYLGTSTEDFVDSIDWFVEEMQEEMGEDFAIPVDKPGAQVLYLPHPLEVSNTPFLLMAAIKILHAAGEDYTFSSHHFDVTNYAFYQGSKENTLRIVRRVLEARERLGAKSIVLAPCGHGYRVLRREGQKLAGGPFPFPVLSLPDWMDRQLRSGRLRLDKDVVEGPLTYHDPCNIARLSGIVEQPRNVLRALTSEFVEMEPNGAWNLCCGGGGGLAAAADLAEKRIACGRAKAEQIRRTGAKVVVTACYNCMTQIRDLIKTYDLNVKVKSIVEVVAESLQKGS